MERDLTDLHRQDLFFGSYFFSVGRTYRLSRDGTWKRQASPWRVLVWRRGEAPWPVAEGLTRIKTASSG